VLVHEDKGSVRTQYGRQSENYNRKKMSLSEKKKEGINDLGGLAKCIWGEVQGGCTPKEGEERKNGKINFWGRIR